jgi:hypothetical protein
MQMRQPLGHHQAHARALVPAVQTAVELGKGLKQLGQILCGDPWARVPHR